MNKQAFLQGYEMQKQAFIGPGALAGILIGRDGAKDVMAAQITNKEVDAKNTQADKKLEAEIDAEAARLAAKPDGAMPEEQPVDTDWDK
jgi:RNase P/RNase MRP subunit p30